tara:strand:+ start:121 stop:342 length:222 start_codon:yes stop_codon:yes gene_type:complete
MEDLSRRLYGACNRMHDAVSKFYEDVHPDGDPIEDQDDITALCIDLKYYIRLELDYVKELIKEQNEEANSFLN